jgi:hypothetical protein
MERMLDEIEAGLDGLGLRGNDFGSIQSSSFSFGHKKVDGCF